MILNIINQELLKNSARYQAGSYSPTSYLTDKESVYDCNIIALLRYVLAHQEGLRGIRYFHGCSAISGQNAGHAWLEVPLRLKSGEEYWYIINTTQSPPARLRQAITKASLNIEYDSEWVVDPLEAIYSGMIEVGTWDDWVSRYGLALFFDGLTITSNSTPERAAFSASALSVVRRMDTNSETNYSITAMLLGAYYRNANLGDWVYSLLRRDLQEAYRIWFEDTALDPQRRWSQRIPSQEYAHR